MYSAKILIALSFIGLTFYASSQDRIVYKSGEEIMGWVAEISDQEIRYRVFEMEEPLVIVKSKKVDHIVLRTGEVLKFRKGEFIQMTNKPGDIMSPLSIGTGLNLISNYGETLLKFYAANNFRKNITFEIFAITDMALIGGGLDFKRYQPLFSENFKGYLGLGALLFNHDVIFAQIPLGLSYSIYGFEFRTGMNLMAGRQELRPAYELLVGFRF